MFELATKYLRNNPNIKEALLFEALNSDSFPHIDESLILEYSQYLENNDIFQCELCGKYNCNVSEFICKECSKD
jgi:hypothetical protein